METRNIKLSLEKAQQLYNSDSKELKEIALLAYTEDELVPYSYTKIKTFKDAYEALGLSEYNVECDINALQNYNLEENLNKHIVAIYKLDIIRKALNHKYQTPITTKATVYTPYLLIRKKEDFEVTHLNKLLICDKVYEVYTTGYKMHNPPLNDFMPGSNNLNIGLLGCSSMEIANHMAKYFYKEIFDACYAQHGVKYTWLE